MIWKLPCAASPIWGTWRGQAARSSRINLVHRTASESVPGKESHTIRAGQYPNLKPLRNVGNRKLVSRYLLVQGIGHYDFVTAE